MFGAGIPDKAQMAQRGTAGVAVDRSTTGGECRGPGIELDVWVGLIRIPRSIGEHRSITGLCPGIHQRVAAGLGFSDGIGRLVTSDSLQERSSKENSAGQDEALLARVLFFVNW